MAPILQIALTLTASPHFKDFDVRASDFHVVDVLEPIVAQCFLFGGQLWGRFDRMPDEAILILSGCNNDFWVEIEESLVRHRPAWIKPDTLTGD